jgi:hypothetical protein
VRGLMPRTDKVIRVHAASWERARDFARASARDIKEITSQALDEYIEKERALDRIGKPIPVDAVAALQPPPRTSLFPVLGVKL